VLIRAGQVASFSRLASQKFVDRVLAHWSRCFADSIKDLDPRELETLAMAGIDKAARYSITSERDVCEFLDVMLIFGTNFDDDARYVWFRHALRSPFLSEPSERVSYLKEAARKYRESV
jgi:hypothetical protein